MAAKLAGCTLLACSLTLVAGCDPNGPLAPVRDLPLPAAQDPPPAMLAVQVSITSATSPPPLRHGAAVGQGAVTPFQVTWEAEIDALNNNVVDITIVPGLTTTTGLSASGEPLDIEWLIVGNPATVTGTFTGETPLDEEGRIVGQVDLSVNGTDMGTGDPVSTTASGEFTIDVTTTPPPPPAGCQQTTTNGCAFGRFDISMTGTDAQGNTTNGPVEVHYFDGAQFNLFNVPFLVQIQNGCPVNDHWWVFADAASNVEVILSVLDTQTGQTRVYTDPPGGNVAIQDTAAFATCP